MRCISPKNTPNWLKFATSCSSQVRRMLSGMTSPRNFSRNLEEESNRSHGNQGRQFFFPRLSISSRWGNAVAVKSTFSSESWFFHHHLIGQRNMFLQPHQLGVGVSVDAETAVHTTGRHLKNFPPGQVSNFWILTREGSQQGGTLSSL